MSRVHSAGGESLVLVSADGSGNTEGKDHRGLHFDDFERWLKGGLEEVVDDEK